MKSIILVIALLMTPLLSISVNANTEPLPYCDKIGDVVQSCHDRQDTDEFTKLLHVITVLKELITKIVQMLLACPEIFLQTSFF